MKYNNNNNHNKIHNSADFGVYSRQKGVHNAFESKEKKENNQPNPLRKKNNNSTLKIAFFPNNQLIHNA